MAALRADTDDEYGELGDDIGEDQDDPLAWVRETGPYARIAMMDHRGEMARNEARADAAVLRGDGGYATDREVYEDPPRAVLHKPYTAYNSNSPSFPAPAKPAPHVVLSEPAAPSVQDVPPARKSASGAVTCAAAVARVAFECLAGVWELGRTAIETVCIALLIEPQMQERDGSPRSSAVRGKLLALVTAQILVLGLQLGLLAAVGVTGVFASVVHTDFMAVQAAGLVAVPIGVYVYVFGKVDPSSRGGGHVYTLYMVCELAKMCGDFVNIVRFGAAYDDSRHMAMLLAPDHVVMDEAWDHGVCGQPHVVGGLLIGTAALGAVLSGLNVVSLLGRHRTKLKAVEPDHGDANAVVVPMRSPDGDDPSARESTKRRLRQKTSHGKVVPTPPTPAGTKLGSPMHTLPPPRQVAGPPPPPTRPKYDKKMFDTLLATIHEE